MTNSVPKVSGPQAHASTCASRQGGNERRVAAPAAGNGSGSGLPRRMATAWLVVGAAVLLAGCETLQKLVPSGLFPSEVTAPAPDVAWQEHLRVLSGFRTWTLRGTLTVSADGEKSQIDMQWRESPETYVLRFTGPLGVGLLEVEGSDAGVEARFPDGRRIRAASPEALLEAEIGWSVPLQGLRYWIVGVPAPDGTLARLNIDESGRLAGLEQAGWTVVYERYRRVGDLALPEHVRFSSGSVEVTVIVRRWNAKRDAV